MAERLSLIRKRIFSLNLNGITINRNEIRMHKGRSVAIYKTSHCLTGSIVYRVATEESSRHLCGQLN